MEYISCSGKERKYFEIVKELEPELIVLETAYKYLGQVKDRKKILEEETAYIKELMRNAQI